MSDQRYTHLKGHLYYDNKEKVIVQSMGNRYVFLRHDRRGSAKTAAGAGRRDDAKMPKGYLLVSAGLYFNTATHQLYKKTGASFVLYTKDRRKERKNVSIDRRKRG